MAKKKSGKRIGLPTGMNLAQYIAFESARKSMIANKEAIIYHANLMTQRALWMCVVAIHDAYGYGQKNINKFLNQMNAVQEEYVQMVEDGDEEYADEKLRMRASELSGIDITYLEETVNAIQGVVFRLNQGGENDE